jgi:hypothetical protein
MLFNFLVVVTTPLIAAAVAENDFEKVSRKPSSPKHDCAESWRQDFNRWLPRSVHVLSEVAGIENNSTGIVGGTIPWNNSRPVHLQWRAISPPEDGCCTGGGRACIGLPTLQVHSVPCPA